MGLWSSVRLGDVIITNGQTYSPKSAWSFVNYLDTGNITENVIGEIQLIEIGKEKLPSRARRIVKHNSIIYSTVRPNQRHYGIIKSQPENFLVSTGFVVIDVDESKADADYIYFLLSQNTIVEKLHAIAEQSVSAYPSIKPSDIENLEVELPPLDVQKRIADILKTISDKMVSNTDINKNLEEQAQAVFKEKFPNILTGICNDTLSSIITFSNGRKRPINDGNVPVYGGNGILSYTDETNANNCVIVGRVGAYCGNTYLCLGNCWISDNAIQAKSKTGESQLFVYYLLKNAKLPSRHIGSGQPLMTQGILNTIPFVHPSEEEVKQFIEFCTPIHNAIDKTCIENQKLAELRDTLLPRLMSGELDVSNLDL